MLCCSHPPVTPTLDEAGRSRLTRTTRQADGSNKLAVVQAKQLCPTVDIKTLCPLSLRGKPLAPFTPASTPPPALHCRWKEEKVLRVWTPPGYSRGGAPPGGWPVLWMNDGMNMFEDWLAHQARCKGWVPAGWRAAAGWSSAAHAPSPLPPAC